MGAYYTCQARERPQHGREPKARISQNERLRSHAHTTMNVPDRAATPPDASIPVSRAYSTATSNPLLPFLTSLPPSPRIPRLPPPPFVASCPGGREQNPHPQIAASLSSISLSSRHGPQRRPRLHGQARRAGRAIRRYAIPPGSLLPPAVPPYLCSCLGVLWCCAVCVFWWRFRSCSLSLGDSGCGFVVIGVVLASVRLFWEAIGTLGVLGLVRVCVLCARWCTGRGVFRFLAGSCLCF